jgi:hypothetical protein
MEIGDFLFNCVVALVTVYLVLTALAVLIRLLTVVFPQKYSDDNPAIVVSFTSHLNRIYPQTKITKSEEKVFDFPL